MDIETFLAKKAELDGLLKTHAKDMIKSLFGELFVARPDIKTVTWSQYTPYFNDGDACTFGVKEPHFATKYPEDIEDFSAHGGDESDEDCWVNASKYTQPKPPKVITDFVEAFESAEEILESLGDHAHVTVTNRADGIVIDVEEYEHD